MRGEMMIIIISLSIEDNNNRRTVWIVSNTSAQSVEALVLAGVLAFALRATRSSPLLTLGRVPTTGCTQRLEVPSLQGYVNSVVIAAMQRTPSMQSSPLS